MLEKFKIKLTKRIKDKKLADEFISSYDSLAKEFTVGKPMDMLQKVGLYVEAGLRVTEHLVLGNHTPISSKLDIDNVIDKLQNANGSEGLRIHSARLFRSVYDFRTRKKSVHLKDIDPQLIDAYLVFNICTWILIEILKEAGFEDPEEEIRMLATRKTPLLQEIDGILRTTNPKLSGPERLLILMYGVPLGLNEDQLLDSTRPKIKDKNHLRTNLRDLYKKDLVHRKRDGNWVIFGDGIKSAENLVSRLTS